METELLCRLMWTSCYEYYFVLRFDFPALDM